MTLPRVLLAALISVSGAGGVLGQAAPEGQARTIDTTNSTSLSPDKQTQVRDTLRQYETMAKGEAKVPKVEQAVSVGSSVPDNIDPIALPQDRVTDVPQVTSYRFFLAQNGIAVVNPETKQVVQIIPDP